MSISTSLLETISTPTYRLEPVKQVFYRSIKVIKPNINQFNCQNGLGEGVLVMSGDGAALWAWLRGITRLHHHVHTGCTLAANLPFDDHLFMEHIAFHSLSRRRFVKQRSHNLPLEEMHARLCQEPPPAFLAVPALLEDLCWIIKLEMAHVQPTSVVILSQPLIFS